MKHFFEGIVTIPEGRKAGKYLQKIAEVSNLSDLCKSLDLCIVELNTQAEYFKALKSCHSCQSNGIETMGLFYFVWSQIRDVKFLGLVDNAGDIKARCLVNPSQGTYAPCYGNGHYMLGARLEFAGFESGEIIDCKTVEDLLKREIEPISITPPKSEAVETYVFVYGIDSKDLSAIEDIKKYWQGRNTYHVPAWWMARPEFGGLKEYREFCQNQLTAGLKARTYLKRYNKLFKKYNPDVKYGQCFTYLKKELQPISEKYRFEAGEITSQKSSFYLDSEKVFLEETIVKNAGWYQY